MSDLRFVVDTNVLVSATMLERSIPAIALQKAENTGIVLYSPETLAELTQVLLRPKFLRYVTVQQVEGLFSRIQDTWEKVTITQHIRICRDPRDDQFLELAMNGNASTLITGDQDLLALMPYRQLGIIAPAGFI